jgi:lysophospholipid acyltransferase (LPLAT)-like uncharacterized protein
VTKRRDDDMSRAPGSTRAPSATRRRRVRAGKRVRRWLAARLVGLAAVVLPRLYVAYMWLVEVTSRHDDGLTTLLSGCRDRHDRAVAVLWHQEVFSVAYNYRHFHGHTLASVSDFGRVITALLERCNFVVLRGGTGSRSRKRAVVPELIANMQVRRGVIYGLTVDGSQGPVYRMKPGAAVIARACRAPVVAVRTWYRRGISLRTWDRTQIPLPFNHRVTVASGPYWIAPDADDAALQSFCTHLDSELLELTARAYEALGDSAPPKPYWGFPSGWTSHWSAGSNGRKHGAYDLDPDAPPPWAHVAPERSAAAAEPASVAGDDARTTTVA